MLHVYVVPVTYGVRYLESHLERGVYGEGAGVQCAEPASRVGVEVGQGRIEYLPSACTQMVAPPGRTGGRAERGSRHLLEAVVQFP